MVYESLPDEVYAIDLHLICGGYAYFSACAGWVATNKETGRDVRKPCLVNAASCNAILQCLDINPFLVADPTSYNCWLLHRGWAMVEKSFAENEMKAWLAKRQCISDPIGSFTDTEIATLAATSDRTSRMREVVLQRDGCRCLACGKWSEFDRDITMHHVRPFSRGGETTSRNIVPLCPECNQKFGQREIDELYELAGIPHAFDHGFLSDSVSIEAIQQSLQITRNLMHTRCVLP